MAEKYLVEPDLGFIEEVSGFGGQDLKKCFQCATCSVVCPISPENKPFPRKEMIAASWGLEDRLIGNADIWLCHNCGDCSTYCPRGAKPGDVLAAIRTLAITKYAPFKKLGQMVNDPKKLPTLVVAPVVIFLVVGLLTGLLHLVPAGDEIIHGKFFFSTWLVDLIFVPLALCMLGCFAIGLKRFLADIHANALLEGKTDKKTIDPVGFVKALRQVIPTILKHEKFSACEENQDRSTAHMMVLYGFIGLFIVTSVFFVVLYVFHIEAPYSQLNPVKWLANVSGIILVIGASLLIKNRLDKKDQFSHYKDWILLALVLGLGVTGLLTEMTRLGHLKVLSYSVYFVHLIFVFYLFAYLPFSKLAHLVYRTAALAYAEYSERK